ncbi:MAG TPA: YgeY family selenium metabolism-linked hydrolase [Aggregatilinea sp.]|uniref:YgeY family selenium metabolism-linked hydrolase n=1 Tax=Aggregatilinea sp. TaxID=2806333 RepID=UPI002CD33F67|nr:YgeY family selenium metabolism-linked hydrolase [Aggregatilinea sp.]HML23593.1 YgeY family selenium metabolism-linked hydrolase [Aggregatilinea sp.]
MAGHFTFLHQLEPEWATAQDLYTFTQKLIQTPSTSTHEGDVAALVAEHLTTLGFPHVHVSPMGCVIATLGNGNGPTLLYDAHMDTVEPATEAWPHPPFDGVIENGALYGLGAVDMKSAISTMVYGARQLLPYQDEIDGTLVLAFVVQEEPCEGLAIRTVVEEDGIRPDYVLIGEPSNMQISRGQRGRVMFKVSVRGKSCHASQPALGQNAIYAASRLVFNVELLADTLLKDPFLGPGTIAVTGIESRGASLNAIPDLCKLYVDRRLTLGETVNGARAQLESMIARENLPATVEITTYEEASYTGMVRTAREAHPAWVLDRAHPLVTALSHTIQTVRGAAPEITHWPFSTDGAYTMGEAGIPTVGFGPGDPNLAHTPREVVRLDDLKAAAHVYAGFAAMMLMPGKVR